MSCLLAVLSLVADGRFMAVRCEFLILSVMLEPLVT
jgi:hypothetical protein